VKALPSLASEVTVVWETNPVPTLSANGSSPISKPDVSLSLSH